jgi:PKD repeat protein
MKKYLRLISLFAAGLILFTACSKDKPLPTATIESVIVSNQVTFTVTATDAESYLWDFGDGSVVSTVKDPVHVYLEYGKTYAVVLTVTGPGGTITVNHSIVIPAMTKMEMITGGALVTTGKKWRMSSSTAAYRAKPDATLTIDKTYPAGVLSALGYTTVYTDQFTFFSNNNYAITPKGTGVAGGLIYCTINSIPNTPPSADAAGAGLTLLTPFTAPTGLTFALNESKTLTVATTADGVTTTNVVYNGVSTLSFSAGGFIGMKDFMSECIIQEITATTLKLAFFVSVAPPTAPQVGKATNVLIFSFEVAP